MPIQDSQLSNELFIDKCAEQVADAEEAEDSIVWQWNRFPI